MPLQKVRLCPYFLGAPHLGLFMKGACNSGSQNHESLGFKNSVQERRIKFSFNCIGTEEHICEDPDLEPSPLMGSSAPTLPHNVQSSSAQMGIFSFSSASIYSSSRSGTPSNLPADSHGLKAAQFALLDILSLHPVGVGWRVDHLLYFSHFDFVGEKRLRILGRSRDCARKLEEGRPGGDPY